MTLFVFEKMDKARERKVFRLFGVDYYATPLAWLYPFLLIGIGVGLAFFFAPTAQLVGRLLYGLAYAGLIFISGYLHNFGHIFSSWSVGAPMDSTLLTSVVELTRYEDKEEQPSRVHIGRAIGGPAANLLVWALVWGLGQMVGPNHLLTFFANTNLVIGLLTLLPIPSVDGYTILQALLNWTR